MRYLMLGLALCMGAAAMAAEPVRLPDGLTPSGGDRGGIPVYDDLGANWAYYFPAGAGVETGDDIHVSPNVPFTMTGFAFGLYNSGGDTTATINFWEMPVYDNVPVGAQLYTATVPIAAGFFGIVTVDPSVPMPADFWMGVAFGTGSAGLLIYDPPVVGTSHDLFLIGNAGPYWFGGNPVANFSLAVYTPEPASLGLLALGALLLRRR